MKSRDLLRRRAYHLLGLSTVLSKQALNRGEDSTPECLLQVILGEYRLPSPNPEIQNPYSKEEPFDKTQTLLCSNASFNPKYLRRTLFQEIPQAETSSPQFKLLACSHPLWDVIGLA